MATETIGIRVEAEIQDLIAEFSRIPGVTDKQARAALKKLDVNLTKMRRAAEKQARAQARAYDKAFDDMGRAAERSASLMGGVFGDISDTVLDLGGQIGEIAGGLGGLSGAAFASVAGIGALTAAFGFAAHGMMEWMEGADELRESLEGVAGIDPLPPHLAANLARYEEAARDAEAASAAASLTLMGQLAPAMTEVQHVVIGASHALSEIVGLTESWDISLGGLVRQMANAGPATALLVQAWDYLADSGEELAAQIETVDKALDELDFGDDFGPSIDAYNEGLKEAEQRHRAAAKAAEERTAAEQAAIDETVAMATAYLDNRVAYEAELAAKQQARAEREAEIAAAELAFREDIEAASQASHEAEMMRIGLRRDAYSNLYTEVHGLSASVGESIVTVMERQNDKLNEQFAIGKERRDQQREDLDAQLEAGQISEAYHKREMDRIAAEGHAARKERNQTEKEQQRAALAAFRMQQGAAIADAIMQAAANAVRLTAAFWYMGFGAPVAAAGVAGGQLAAQLAVIKSQKPPEFPTGGMVQGGGSMAGMSPDHVAVGAQVGEAVLTRQGVDNLGGPDAVDAVNAGMRGGGGATYVVLDSEVLGMAVERTAARGYLGRDTRRRGKPRGRRR